MVKGKHDFFTNQFLPLVSKKKIPTLCASRKAATHKPKNILCHVVPLIACRTFTKPATIILVQ